MMPSGAIPTCASPAATASTVAAATKQLNQTEARAFIIFDERNQLLIGEGPEGLLQLFGAHVKPGGSSTAAALQVVRDLLPGLIGPSQLLVPLPQMRISEQLTLTSMCTTHYFAARIPDRPDARRSARLIVQSGNKFLLLDFLQATKESKRGLQLVGGTFEPEKHSSLMTTALDEAFEVAGLRLRADAPQPRHLPESAIIEEYPPGSGAPDQRPEVWITDYFLIDLEDLEYDPHQTPEVPPEHHLWLTAEEVRDMESKCFRGRVAGYTSFAPIDLLFKLSESDLEPTARSGKPKLTQQWFSLKELQEIYDKDRFRLRGYSEDFQSFIPIGRLQANGLWQPPKELLS